MTDGTGSSVENVRMSALLKGGGRTDDRPDETSGTDQAVTCGDTERPDETSDRTSGQFLIFPDVSDEWPARLDALVEGARRRKAERQQQAVEKAARRAAGLRARHARKLARNRRTDPPEAA